MERVVITGMGAITPVGNDVQTFWGIAQGRKVRHWADHQV